MPPPSLSSQGLPTIPSRLDTQSLVGRLCTFADHLLYEIDSVERAPISRTGFGRACLALLSLSGVLFAAYRLSRKSEATRLSANNGRYAIAKPDGLIDLNSKFKNHSYKDLDRKPTYSIRASIMKVLGNVFIGLLGLYSLANALSNDIRHVSPRNSAANSTSVLNVFEVYKPVEFTPPSQGCSDSLLLMEHEFAFSYGKPFIGDYTPPECDFDTVRINLTVTSKGRQFDRLALMYLNDTEVFRTSTAEPTTNGIIWTYIKEMSQYLVLWKSHQKIIFDLGNLIDDTYTGPFNVTLTASFTKENKGPVADVILPISSRQSAKNGTSAFNVPDDNATVSLLIPKNAQRAVVSISACGQIGEEFWWSNVLSQDTDDFNSTVGELYGYSPFREIQLYIDGLLAGVVWPFPIIFTGGVAPGFWRPIVGIDAFDLREPEIDISPFLPLLTDGEPHTFQIKIVGLDTPSPGEITLSETVGSYWVVTGKVFIYLEDDASHDTLVSGKPPTIDAPDPKFSFTRNLFYNPITGKNETLSYSVKAHRTLKIASKHNTWTQDLSFSNDGLLNQAGLSQRNIQNTTGTSIASGVGINGKFAEEITSFSYPIDANTTYDLGTNYTIIDAAIDRELQIYSTGGLGISTYSLVSGPIDLRTRQWGTAHYSAVSGGPSTSSGDTSNDFHESSGGTTFDIFVRAINGSVVTGNGPPGSEASSATQSDLHATIGRPSVRSILGRGPSSNIVHG